MTTTLTEVKSRWHWKAIAAAALTVGVGVTIASASSDDNGRSVPRVQSGSVAPTISSAVETVLGDQNISLAAVPSGTTPPISSTTAQTGNVLDTSDIVAEQLVELTGPMTGGSPELVWAIQESLTGTAGQVSSAALVPGGGAVVATSNYNFRIDFVNADTGSLVFATEGRSS